jgi:hypothetical protein
LVGVGIFKEEEDIEDNIQVDHAYIFGQDVCWLMVISGG